MWYGNFKLNIFFFVSWIMQHIRTAFISVTSTFHIYMVTYLSCMCVCIWWRTLINSSWFWTHKRKCIFVSVIIFRQAKTSDLVRESLNFCLSYAIGRGKWINPGPRLQATQSLLTSRTKLCYNCASTIKFIWSNFCVACI